MRKIDSLVMVGLVVLSLAVFMPHALAEEPDPIVKIFDSTFTTETDYFSTCPVTVGIKTWSNVQPYDVIIVEPDGVTTHTIATGQSSGVWHSFTYTSTKIGWWTCKAGSTTIPFGVGTFYVVPDLPIGTLLAVVASFGAFGILKLKKARFKQIKDTCPQSPTSFM